MLLLIFSHISLFRRFSNFFLLFIILAQTLSLPWNYCCLVPCSLGLYVWLVCMLYVCMFTKFVCLASCSHVHWVRSPLFLLTVPRIPLTSTNTTAWSSLGFAEHSCSKPHLFCFLGSLEIQQELITMEPTLQPHEVPFFFYNFIDPIWPSCYIIA